jgi:hypothetical protein
LESAGSNYQLQKAKSMTISLAYLVHPIISRAFVNAEQNAKDVVLEMLPKDQNTALQPEENTNGSVPVPLISPESSQDVGSEPSGTPPVAPTSTPVTLTPDAEF